MPDRAELPGGIYAGKETPMDKQARLYRGLLILSLALLAALLLPLLWLGPCAVPCADDYSFGAPARHAWEESGSLRRALGAGLGKTAETWLSWQGSFAAVFLMAVQPAVFGERLYALTPLLMLSALLLGVFTLLPALFGELFRTRRDTALITAAGVCALCVQLAPSPVQAFFWYNGAVYYVLFYGLSLAAMALAIRLVRRGGGGRLALLSLLCVILGGGNYVTALVCAVLGTGALCLMCALKTPGRGRLVLPVLLLLAAFGLSVLAPGNAGREAALGQRPGALRAIGLSFQSGARYALSWLLTPLPGLLLLLFPLLRRAAAESDFAFPLPGAVTAGSCCLLSAMFCPPIYAMGNVGELRLVNIIFFAFVLLCALNLFYWLGWAAKRRGARPGPLRLRALLPGAAALIVCCALWIGAGRGFSSYAALGSLRGGEARAFRDCADRRLLLLRDGGVRDALLEDYPCRPWLLFYDDISPDPEDWRNIDMSSYYGKNSVRLAPGQ